jgi:hypothetical protein
MYICVRRLTAVAPCLLTASLKDSSRGVMAGVLIRLDTQLYTAELPTTGTGLQISLAYNLLLILNFPICFEINCNQIAHPRVLYNHNAIN